MIFPEMGIPPLAVISPLSMESLGNATGNALTSGSLTGAASITVPNNGVAADAILVPFSIHKSTLFKIMWVYVGSLSVAGNVIMGIYTLDGVRLVSASATIGTANTVQTVDITDTYLTPGTYYMALSWDNPTATVFALSPVQGIPQSVGLAEVAGAGALNATITPASVNQGAIPMFGLCTRTVM